MSIAIHSVASVREYDLVATRPSEFAVAVPLPDRCSEHGRATAVRVPIEARFGVAEPESCQLTFIRHGLEGPRRGNVQRALRAPTADAVVAADWPCCSSCLFRMRVFRWIGRILVGIAVVSVVVALAAIFAPMVDRSLATGDNLMLFFRVAAAFLFVPVAALIAARAAFSYTRAVLHARLNVDRTALIVSAAHPDFGAELEELSHDA